MLAYPPSQDDSKAHWAISRLVRRITAGVAWCQRTMPLAIKVHRGEATLEEANQLCARVMPKCTAITVHLVHSGAMARRAGRYPVLLVAAHTKETLYAHRTADQRYWTGWSHPRGTSCC